MRGGYYGWYYHMNDSEDWGSAYGGDIDFSTYTDVMNVWYNRGTEAALTSQALTLSCANASIYDYAGNLAAAVRDGEVISNRTDIFALKDPVGAGTDPAGPDWASSLRSAPAPGGRR